MRRTILVGVIAAIAFPVAAPAQSRGEIRRDRQEVQVQRDDLREAYRRGDRGDIREERRDVREAREELREDRRDRNRDRYAAPYRDWRYSSVRPGYRLRPAFYGSRYQIGDLGRYRLRPTARNQRWVRYGDDLLLVNVRNGRVLQVLSDRY